MRTATLLVGTFLLGALAVTVLTGLDRSRAASPGQHAAAVGVGIVMVLLWLAAVSAVVWYPRVAMVLCLLAAALGLVGGRLSDVEELAPWAGVSAVLAAASYLGHRGKRADDREARAEADERARLRWEAHLAAANPEARADSAQRQAQLAAQTAPPTTGPPATPVDP